MKMLIKQTLCKPWTKYTQKAEEIYTKQTKERVYKDTRRRNIEQCKGFIMGCYKTWNNDDDDNNKHTDYVKWMESVAIF
jgi:hypothetical protein